MLQNGVEVDKKDVYLKTPLWHAAEKGHIEVVDKLLSCGENVNSVDNGGQIPFHDAARKGHLQVGGKLLSCGANVNAEFKNGNTLLHWAAEKGHLGLLKSCTLMGQISTLVINMEILCFIGQQKMGI